MKMFKENLRLALTSLYTNKSRTLLTMLGIIIGIASVIAIMTVGNSLSVAVSDKMQTMGANNVWVIVEARKGEQEKKENGIVFGEKKIDKDMEESDLITDEMVHALINKFNDKIDAVAAASSIGTGSISKGTKDYDIDLNGVSMGYFKANDIKMVEGSLFSQKEYLGSKNVIIISNEMAKDYFDDDSRNVLGKEIKIDLKNKKVVYTVVGLYKYEENSEMSTGTTKKTSYIPLTTCQKNYHTKNYAFVSLVTKVGVDSNKFAIEARDFVNDHYRGNKYYHANAFSMSSLVDMMDEMMGTITTAVSVIAGIALLVGGIGVMNIMLVSITERTREIGTRKALGATNGNIRTQFIVEAMIMCLIGGIIGILFGLFLGSIGAKIMGYPANPSLSSIVISIGFSLAIGLFFGYYPANKAAKMNPIDALRYE